MNQDGIVYVVDDDADSRESAVALLTQLGLGSQSFASAREFLSAYTGHRPACLLTDHRMLGMTGIELLETLRRNNVSIAVVVMTAYAETDLTVRAMQSGAVRLIEKPFRDDTVLWNAVHEAFASEEDVRHKEARRDDVQSRIESLSEGEREVLKMMMDGAQNKQMAAALSVSIRTIENRRSAVFSKIGAESIAELMRVILESGADPN